MQHKNEAENQGTERRGFSRKIYVVNGQGEPNSTLN
jgi:hypothetical protein